MEKKYLMFVDERGFLTDKDENLTMIGVVFEGDYCSNSKYYECELKMKLDEYKKKIFGDNSIHLDDIFFKENVYVNLDKYQRNKLINELPSLFKSLNFSIIFSTVKKDMKDSYSIAAKKLLQEFYTYIMKKNGQSGGMVLEYKADNTSCSIQQSFFDIYDERSVNLNILGDISEKINTFIVCEKNNILFEAGIEMLNILKNILFRVLNGQEEFDLRLIECTKYGCENKMYDLIKSKVYRYEEVRIGQDRLMREAYNINRLNEELNDLKAQLINKNIIIDKKEEELEKLTDEVQFLKEQLEIFVFSNERETMMSKILSEIDVKIQGLDKITSAAKN